MKIAYAKPWFDEREAEAVGRVLKGTSSEAYQEIVKFQDEFSTYISPPGENYYCLFTNSCTSALKLAWKYFKECKFRRYYRNLTPNTYCATFESAEEIGLHLANDESTMRVATHYGGILWDINRGAINIEDSAHRIEPNDILVSQIRCYSFHEGKNMACGFRSSGGMFVTKDKEIYEWAKLQLNDGRIGGTEAGYKVVAMAGGYEGDPIAATIGRVQLTKLPAFDERRIEIRNMYNQAFNADWQGTHLYPYFVKNTEQIKDLRIKLSEKGIETSYHYPNIDGTYRKDWLAVSLPIYPLLTNDEVEYIINAVLS